jgi:hypothetical protein
MFPCKNFSYYPKFARSTSNSLCITHKKNNLFVSTKTIKIGDKTYRIPCFLLNHVAELEQLLKTYTFKEAVILLAAKYDVSLALPIQNIKRYIYPTVGGKLVPKPIQFKVTFKLMETVTVTQTFPTQKNVITYSDDARRVAVCADNTKTFITSFSDMKKECTFWVNKLPTFSQPYYYAVISSTTLLNAHSGVLLLQDDSLVFVPVINKNLVFLYQPYSEGTPFIFAYLGVNGETPYTTIMNMYIPQQLSCIYGLVKT